MSNLLELTGDDIERLNDADFRELIGLLCEADFHLSGLPAKGITWGGHQDAPDGGLDVVVRDCMPTPQNSFIPRSITGFQVKKSDMPRTKILNEMKPNGILREEIKSLIREHGAYIIVSSSGATTDIALKRRIGAMKEAIANEIDFTNLHVDFYDRGRVATWIRTHPSLILWVRNKIGRQLKGWHPYQNWSYAPGGVEEEYLLDEGIRLHDGNRPNDKGLSIKDGLQKLRYILHTPRVSVRLAGLSGVGKTRLVQALFEEKVGEKALNRSQAFYTNMSDGPDPDPITCAEQLINVKTRAILIVDNCPPKLHHRLTQICSEPHSTISLLTVEYDVRDDLPEETSVFRLEPASEEIIEKLIKKRFSYISQVDARTIANFSGGNARIAIVLANTVRQGETLSGFHDEELFERLFKQRYEENENLLISAEVCSLVYSFQGIDINTEKSELNILASIIDKSVSDLYRDISTLKKRELIQSRDVWRAVLPHAIANRLAKRALESIHRERIVKTILEDGSERFIKSFARRLSYLHDCNSAIEIVNEWLSKDGWIGKENCCFTAFGMDVFKNIAPVSPEMALEVIERAANGSDGNKFTSRENNHYYEFARILRHLAFDPKLFHRSVNILIRFALSERLEENYNSTRDILKSLFYIIGSGTHATVEARVQVIDTLFKSKDNQELALILLEAALEAWNFGIHYEVSFGARPRDFGYQPRSKEEVEYWYTKFIDICTRLTISDLPIAIKARKILSNSMRGLWTKRGMFDVLEESIKKIHEHQTWNEGWVAVRGIIRVDGKHFGKEINEKLIRLEEILKPKDIYSRVRTYALLDENNYLDMVDDIDINGDITSSIHRMETIILEIGKEISHDQNALNILMAELVSTHSFRLYHLGRGLADGSENKKKIWGDLYDQFERTPVEKRNIFIFLGFLSLCAERDPIFYNSTLDSLINDKLFGEFFPSLQTTSKIDQKGVERLLISIETGLVPMAAYKTIAYGRAHESISDDDLANILEKILSKKDGINTVIEILKMRFWGTENSSSFFSSKLLDTGRIVLTKFTFPGDRNGANSLDLELQIIASRCLKGEKGIDTAKELCNKYLEASRNNRISTYKYLRLLNSIADSQPLVFLNSFLGSEDIESIKYSYIITDLIGSSNPFKKIAEIDLISWCEINPEDRYPKIAFSIPTFLESSVSGELELNPIIENIFKKSPDLHFVLELIGESIQQQISIDLRKEFLPKLLIFYNSLKKHDNAEIRSWAKAQYLDLQEKELIYNELNNKPISFESQSFE